MSIHVEVQLTPGAVPVPDTADIVSWATAALAAQIDDGEVSIRVVDDAEGAELNTQYRRGEGATNVLAFPFHAPEHTAPPLLGDVVICAPVVEREACEQGKSTDAHFAHMVVHGTLHLLGHDHREAAAAARMEALERRVLAGLGIADPYALDGS